MVSGASPADPNQLTDTPNHDYNAFSTKTPSDPRTIAGPKVLTILTFGQSNSCGVAPSIFVPVNSRIWQVNICNGGFYAASDPLLGVTVGTGPGNYALRLADAFRTAAVADDVILLPFGVSGSAAADWAVGGAWNHRIKAASKRLSALGLTASGLVYQQGETDTLLGTSQASYAASLASMIATVRSFWSSSVPIFIAQTSYIAGSTSTNVTAAQFAATDHPNGVWQGPNTDTIGAGGRGADSTHFNDTGNATFASLAQTAMGLYGAPFV